MLPLKFSMAFVVRNFVYNAPVMPKALQREGVGEALAHRGCGPRMVGLEGSGQPLQLSLRQGGITGRPRVPQHRGHIRVQMLREMAQHVAPFVELTALDGRERAAHRADGRGERLRTVDHKEARPVRVQAAIDEVTQERFGHAALFGVALPEAQNLLLPLRINAQRDHDRVVTQHDPVDQHDRGTGGPRAAW